MPFLTCNTPLLQLVISLSLKKKGGSSKNTRGHSKVFRGLAHHDSTGGHDCLKRRSLFKYIIQLALLIYTISILDLDGINYFPTAPSDPPLGFQHSRARQDNTTGIDAIKSCKYYHYWHFSTFHRCISQLPSHAFWSPFFLHLIRMTGGGHPIITPV